MLCLQVPALSKVTHQLTAEDTLHQTSPDLQCSRIAMLLPPSLTPRSERSWSVVVVSILFPLLATLTLVGRFVSRRIQKLKYGWDDWIAALALLAVCAHAVLVAFGPYYGGVGHHMRDLRLDNLVAYLRVCHHLQKTQTFLTNGTPVHHGRSVHIRHFFGPRQDRDMPPACSSLLRSTFSDRR